MARSSSRGVRAHDPREDVTPDGLIVTGAHRSRVPAAFESVLGAAIDAVVAEDALVSLYLYGSVATGTARVPSSDVDLFTVGLAPTIAGRLSKGLSTQFTHLCRAVSIGAGQEAGYVGDGWEAYGNRVFLRHYCVHLSGPDHRSGLPDFAADAAAARGFNGDIGLHADRWRAALAARGDPMRLSRRIGRKCLLAVAGLVSVRDGIWTTDRTAAAERWAQLEPALAEGLGKLLEWSRDEGTPDARAVAAALDGIVRSIVVAFETEIGLWEDSSR